MRRLIVRRAGCGIEDSFTREKAEGRWLIDNLQTACFQRKKASSKYHSLLLFTAVTLMSQRCPPTLFFFFGSSPALIKVRRLRIYYLDGGFN